MNRIPLAVTILFTSLLIALQARVSLASDSTDISNRLDAERVARLANLRQYKATAPAPRTLVAPIRKWPKLLPEQMQLPEDRGMPAISYQAPFIHYTLQEVINLMEFPDEHVTSYKMNTRWKVITKENRQNNGLSAIGLVVNPNVSGSCSAFAISKRTILTAAHCLTHAFYTENDQTKQTLPSGRRQFNLENLIFYSNVNDDVDQESLSRMTEVQNVIWNSKQRFIKAEVGPWFETRLANDDWAILTLAENLPTNIQPLKLAPSSEVAKDEPVYSVAYGDSMVPTLLHVSPHSCAVASVEVGLYSHNCPMMTTFSGGPLIVSRNGHFEVLGIMTLEKKAKDVDPLKPPFGYAVDIQSLKEKLKIIE